MVARWLRAQGGSPTGVFWCVCHANCSGFPGGRRVSGIRQPFWQKGTMQHQQDERQRATTGAADEISSEQEPGEERRGSCIASQSASVRPLGWWHTGSEQTSAIYASPSYRLHLPS